MEWSFHQGQRDLQLEFGSERLADRLLERSFQDELDDSDIEFISHQFMFFLATADESAEPFCTFRGGDPGFVRILNRKTILWPEFDGNGMFLSLGNLSVNPNIHLLFIDFERQQRLRVIGRAKLEIVDSTSPDHERVTATVTVDIKKVFPNCKRYIPKLAIVEPARHVPRADVITPVADWKRSDWAIDVLPVNDPALDPHNPD